MPLSSSLRLVVAGDLTSALDLGSAAASTRLDHAVSLTAGTAVGQADKVFADTRTLAASATEDLDLAGVLTDGLGAAITFARIKAMVVRASASNTNNVIVGGASATQFLSWVGAATHTVTLRPGATLALIAGAADATGYVVGTGTADLLKVANSGGVTPVAYDIVLIGASA